MFPRRRELLQCKHGGRQQGRLGHIQLGAGLGTLTRAFLASLLVCGAMSLKLAIYCLYKLVLGAWQMAFVFWSVSFYPQVYTNWKRKAYVDNDFPLWAM